MGRFLRHTFLSAAALTFLFLLHACVSGPAIRPSADPAEAGIPNSVSVGLTWVKEPRGISFEGPMSVGRPGAGEPMTLGNSSGAVELPIERVDEASIRIGRSTYKFASIRLEPKSGWFRIQGVTAGGAVKSARYRGALVLHLTPSGWTVCNEVGIEDYLIGVVGKEMSLSKTPYEALKAQVIAARTYALYERMSGRVRRAGERFDLYDDERSQMYGGMDAESTGASSLVEETRGFVVTFESRLVHTLYSSTCGGATDPAWEVLSIPQRVPPLAGVPCEYCRTSPHFEWRATIRKADLCEKLTGKKGTITSLGVARTSKGGHALQVQFQVAGEAKPRVVDATTGFRHKLGSRTLKSTLLVEIRDAGDVFEVSGRGWGHGAGMCQYGAWEQARLGRSAFDILSFYYPRSRVEKIH